MPPRSLSSDDTQLNRGLAVAVLGLLALAPAAGAASGGATYVPEPKVAKVACVKACAANGRIQAGAAVRITGQNLGSVTKVVFAGGSSKRDDEVAVPQAKSSRSVTVAVPADAHTGPVIATAGGVKSDPSAPIRILPLPAPAKSADLSPATGPRQDGAPALETATSTGRFFFGSQRPVIFTYRLSAPATVDVSVVRTTDGAVVHTWTGQPAGAGETRTVAWKGLDAAGALQPEARYVFRLTARDGAGATVSNAAEGDVTRDAFDLRHHIFPIRGRHNYGQAGARFGAGRSGHSHQGQDVMANCGTRLVAARSGKVVFSGYHSAAGNYIVIRGLKDSFDYVYMHMEAPSPFRTGDRVFTGQQIGTVGTTGSSSACHLHFEEWTAPGWYDGGKPIDPYADLQAWDAFS